MDCLAMLEHSYAMEREHRDAELSRLCFLADALFDFTTYDDEMSELFAERAIAVCESITRKDTFNFIRNPENYRWFLLMCNMPFFADKLEWGTSIRGAWWGGRREWSRIELGTCGLWVDGEQRLDWTFTLDEWAEFMAAVSTFAATPAGTRGE